MATLFRNKIFNEFYFQKYKKMKKLYFNSFTIITIIINLMVLAIVDGALSSLFNGLINYWPISATFNANDVVGCANLFPANGAGYAPDRFGQANGAIRTNSYTSNLYWQAPTGIYFSGDFSVSVWIYKRGCYAWSTIRNLNFVNKFRCHVCLFIK
jgi:hypothetical protein